MFITPGEPIASLYHTGIEPIVQGATVSLTCDVESNPVSTITMYNMNTGQPLKALVTGNQARFIFHHIECTHTGEFVCTAENPVGRVITDSVSLDVLCKCTE